MKSKILTYVKDKFNDWGLMMRRTYPRPMIRQLIGKDNLIGAEIGVFKGRNAKSILKNLSVARLFLIDPYIKYEQYLTDTASWRVHESDIEDVQEIAESRLNSFDNIRWKIMTSQDAANHFGEETLDFLYIDGNHSYEAVKEDIENYYSKIKTGGIIGGHDIELPSVAKAVFEFAVKHNREVHVLSPDWWIVK